MLAAADAAADACGLSHNLGHQPERVAGAGEEVAVAAMVGKYVVGVAEVLGDCDRIGLLADAGMSGAVEQAFLEELEQALLEAADEAEPPVQTLSTTFIGAGNQMRIRSGERRGREVCVD
jgi:hypothetical protein